MAGKIHFVIFCSKDGCCRFLQNLDTTYHTAHCFVIAQSTQFSTWFQGLRETMTSISQSCSCLGWDLNLWSLTTNLEITCFCCYFSSSSVCFTTLCGFCLSQRCHSKPPCSVPVPSNFPHLTPSCRYTHYPAILFVVFLSIGSPLAFILLFLIPSLRNPFFGLR